MGMSELYSVVGVQIIVLYLARGGRTGITAEIPKRKVQNKAALYFILHLSYLLLVVYLLQLPPVSSVC